MSDTPFEIKDDEINVEEIMEKIRENIRRRKEAGIYLPDPDPTVPPQVPAENSTEFARDLACLSGNWDIQNRSYFISSHWPVAGKVLVKGRELVHGEVRRYVDPVIWKQAEFIGKSSSFNVTGFKRGHSDCRSLSSIVFAM